MRFTTAPTPRHASPIRFMAMTLTVAGCGDRLQLDGETFRVRASAMGSAPSMLVVLEGQDVEWAEMRIGIPADLALTERTLDVQQLTELSILLDDGDWLVSGPIVNASGVLRRRPTSDPASPIRAELDVVGDVDDSRIAVHARFDVFVPFNEGGDEGQWFDL